MYIWQWQDTFIDAVKNLLQDIFQTLELPIGFNIFAMAIPIENNDSEQIIFLPSDCQFTSNDFKQVFTLAKHNFDSDPEQFFFMGAAQQNKIHRASLYPKALKKAIQSILQHYDQQSQRISFYSFPIQKKSILDNYDHSISQ